MRQEGFSLIEMLIVIAIAAIIMGAATLNFRDMIRKSSIEGQVKELQADLLNARSLAMNRNRLFFVSLTTTQYTITDDSNDSGVKDAGDTTVTQKSPKNSWNGSADFLFDQKGLAQNLPSDPLTISVANSVNAAYDCVIIAATRVNVGKMNGGACVQK